jgi:hypothetical protein
VELHPTLATTGRYSREISTAPDFRFAMFRRLLLFEGLHNVDDIVYGDGKADRSLGDHPRAVTVCCRLTWLYSGVGCVQCTNIDSQI